MEADTDNSGPRTCTHCGSAAVIEHVKLGQHAEVGGIGPKYRSGWLGVGTEPMFADICRDCGTLTRFYIEQTDREWIQQ